MTLDLERYADTLERYVDDVLADRVPACRYLRLACARHRSDMARAEAGGPFVFDRTHAGIICAFVESMPHIEGEWAERPHPENLLRLEPWQIFIFGSLNGWRRREDGRRRYRTAYIEVPRKNAKSTMAAPAALFFLTMDGEPGAKVFTAATKMKQARLVYEVALAMARRNRRFTRQFRLKTEEHRIRSFDGACFLRPVEGKGSDGDNVHAVIVDELHEHRTPRIWDAYDKGRGARRQSMLWAITTAGDNIAGVCFEKRSYLIKVLEEIEPDDSFFGVIYTIDEGDDPFDEAVWPKANPNLGVSKYLQNMRDEALAARSSPANKGEFLRKHLNVWTSAGVTAFDMDGYRAAEDPKLDRAAFKGMGAELGGVTACDLAWINDFAVVVSLLPDEDRILAFADVFATEAVVKAAGNERFQAWAEMGLLRVCPGHRIDMDAVEACNRDHLDHFKSVRWAFDPHYAAQMAGRLENDYPAEMILEVRNTPMALDEGFQELQGLVAEGLFVTNGSEALRWMASNVVIRRSANGFQMPDKLAPENKIDFISAACMGLSALNAPEVEPKHAPIRIPEGYFVG